MKCLENCVTFFSFNPESKIHVEIINVKIIVSPPPLLCYKPTLSLVLENNITLTLENIQVEWSFSSFLQV